MNDQNGSLGQLLTSEQRDVYLWLKTLGLNTDDSTLCFWSKKYTKQRLIDVISFAKKRKICGQHIRNIGGWIHTMLIKEIPVEDHHVKANRELVSLYRHEKGWDDLKIYEKHVKDLVTGDDISLCIVEDIFIYALESLYRRSQLYKEDSKSS